MDQTCCELPWAVTLVLLHKTFALEKLSQAVIKEVGMKPPEMDTTECQTL